MPDRGSARNPAVCRLICCVLKRSGQVAHKQNAVSYYYRVLQFQHDGFSFRPPRSLVPGDLLWGTGAANSPDSPDRPDSPDSPDSPDGAASLDEKDTTNILSWDASPHDTLLFDSSVGHAYILSAQPYGLRNHRMTHHTRDLLLEHHVILPKSVEELTNHMYDILSCVTGVRRSAEDAQQLMQGAYCLTPDNLLKILALYARVRCGLPVALMGECGCGKTMLLRYLCAWLDVPLRVLDIHGGTTEEDILAAVDDAERLAQDEAQRRSAAPAAGTPSSAAEAMAATPENAMPPEQADSRPLVFLFLDEVNTCPHLGLVHELLCRRSVHGRLVRNGLLILTALNPRRKREAADEDDTTPGLVYSAEQAVADDMADLVYRVHPVSQTLLNFVFDFGTLKPHVEQDYIESMVSHADPGASAAEKTLMTSLILQAQTFIRTTEREASAASLRDVRRCLDLFSWFKQNLSSRTGSRISPSGVCLTLGLVPGVERLASSRSSPHLCLS